MKRDISKAKKIIRKCWREISFKDKGLMLIMIIFILQCIRNLYTVDPIEPEYLTINTIIRTSVASIFGYFLSSNFLARKESRKTSEYNSHKLNDSQKVLENKELMKDGKSKYKNIKVTSKENIDNDRKYFCNRTLQDVVAISICIIATISLIIGIDFKLIPSGGIATISQFRDLISGCIGFLLGNSSNKINR